MDKNIDAILFGMPVDAPDYADNLLDLDIEDVPYERVPEILEIMNGPHDVNTVLRAAILLTYWGIDEGFRFLKNFVCHQEPPKEILMPHRFRGYDETYSQLLLAFRRYWAIKADGGEGDEVRTELCEPIKRIIELSNKFPFEIVQFYWLVEEEGFVEFVPLLKEHLLALLKSSEEHYWKIADCAHLLMKFDPLFVEQSLSQYGKILSDFPNK